MCFGASYWARLDKLYFANTKDFPCFGDGGMIYLKNRKVAEDFLSKIFREWM